MNTNNNIVAISGCDTTSSYLKAEWLEQLFDTDFLRDCECGEITKEELCTFIQQHQIYSRCFTRFLAALLANIENDDHRLTLTQNLFDEMGLGDAGNQPHSKLYLDMMAKMGILPITTPLASTQRLVDTMFECCKSNNYMVGMGALCLGAEGIVPFIYQRIVDGFVNVGEPLANLDFFTLHIECDDGHSDTMNDIIAWELQKSPTALLDLQYGAEKMIQARIDFFDGISVSCGSYNQCMA